MTKERKQFEKNHTVGQREANSKGEAKSAKGGKKGKAKQRAKFGGLLIKGGHRIISIINAFINDRNGFENYHWDLAKSPL